MQLTKSMRLTGSMRLIKSAVGRASLKCAEGRKAYNGGQEAIKV